MRGSLISILAKDRRSEGLQKSIIEASDTVWVYNRGQYLLKASKAKLEVSTAKGGLFFRKVPPVRRPTSSRSCFAKQSEQWLTKTTAQSKAKLAGACPIYRPTLYQSVFLQRVQSFTAQGEASESVPQI